MPVRRVHGVDDPVQAVHWWKQWTYSSGLKLGEEKASAQTEKRVEQPESFKAAVPAFLAPGIGFMGDSFLMDGVVGRMVRMITRALGSGRWTFACLPTAHLLMCSLIPNRLRTGTGPRPRGWGPLFYEGEAIHRSHLHSRRGGIISSMTHQTHLTVYRPPYMRKNSKQWWTWIAFWIFSSQIPCST